MASQSHPAPPRARPAKEPLILDLGFQTRALLPVLLLTVLLAVLVSLLFIYHEWDAARDPDLAVSLILQSKLEQVQFDLWPLLGLAAVVAGYLGFRWSLRIARPVYRLHQHLNELAEGEQKPLPRKPGEEFGFFEDDIAQLNQKMKLIATRNRDILYTVYSYVKKLSDRLEAGDVIVRADLEEAVRSMREHLEKAPEIGLASRR